MSWAETTLLHFIAMAEIMCGLVVNGFITIAKLMDWWGGRKLKPFDKIFFSLGLSRLILLFFTLLNIINRAFSLNFYHINVLTRFLNTVYLFLDFSSLWFTMWISVLYFIKVVIFKNTLLIRMKLKIPELVKYVVLSSMFVSFVSAFIFAYNFEGASDIMIPPRNKATNTSVDKQIIYLAPSYAFGHFLPFILVSVSSLFLIEAIYVHVRRLTSNITSFSTPNMDVHFSAIHSAVMLEVMTVFNLIVTILIRFDFYDFFNKGILFLFAVAYPILHSVALIAGNAKLKKLALGTLKCGAVRTLCTKPQGNVQEDTITTQQTKV
ncbi:taste receptor type 2 member 4-like [Hyla sarda]|uniref:taste receptor type 2 member 4-like n=1 Tax=Hyla sarda TaxID=327740 RepID=UPI0024C31E36|nr:taste receptor type 2 member 4-like [Hyla sarda]